MKTEQQLLSEFSRIERVALHRWIEEGLLQPHSDASGLLFDDIDEARVTLICDLHYGMGLEHDSLPIIMSLIDQLHSTRHRLRAISAAVSEQSEDIRVGIVSRAQIVLRGSPTRD